MLTKYLYNDKINIIKLGGNITMAKKAKLDLSLNNILTCAFYAVIGILLLVLKSGSLNILMTVIGVIFIALGIIDIIQGGGLLKGIIEIVIGAVIITCGWTIATWALLIFGVLLIIKGALDLIKNLGKGLSAMLAPIVTIVIGVLLVVSKFALIDVICIIAGVVFIINAVLTLFGKSLKK